MKRNLRRKSSPNKSPRKYPTRSYPKKIAGGVRTKISVNRLNKMKTSAYESPLRFLQQRRSKRQLIRDELALNPAKKLQRQSQKRESVIIINDENDLDSSPSKRRAAMGQSLNKNMDRVSRMISSEKPEANDSVIILEDDQNQESSVDLNQTEDVMVVWSSVTGSPTQRNENQDQNSNSGSLNFEFDVTPNKANLRMLKGNYPQKWLGDYLKKHEQNYRRKSIKNKKKTNSKKNRAGEKKNEKVINEEIEKQKEERKKAPEEILTGKLREIIIDGANIARAHSKGKFFSVEGLKIVIDYFKERGHPVMAFVPQYERRRDRQILEDLNVEGVITFTPSRKAGNKVITPYDDRFILQYAAQSQGIVVSNDQFKDLYEEKPEWRETIEKRILPPTFVGDILMFPEDPLGRDGPSLGKFLRHEA